MDFMDLREYLYVYYLFWGQCRTRSSLILRYRLHSIDVEFKIDAATFRCGKLFLILIE